MAQEPKHTDTYIAQYKDGREKGELGPMPPEKMEEIPSFDSSLPSNINVNAGAQRKWVGAYQSPIPTVSGSNARFAKSWDRIFGGTE